jgi:DNA-binding response OmpR family regulator/cell division protein FtsN
MTEKSILVVDTDAETVQKIKAALEPEGFSVFSSLGINESVASAQKIIPSLIFVNIAMKDTSGLEISKAVHEIEALQAIPIIIMTPHGGTIEPRYTTTYGIVDFLKKPFSPEELISKTIDILEMNQVAELPAEEAMPPQSAGEISDPHSFEAELSGEEQKIMEMPLEEIMVTPTTAELSGSHESDQILNEPEPVSSSEHSVSDESFSKHLQSEHMEERDEEKKGEQSEKSAEDEESVLLSDLPSHEDDMKNLPDKKDTTGWRKDLLAPIIGVLLIAVGAGFFLYKGLVQNTKTGEPVVQKAPQTIPDQPQQNVPVSPQQSNPPSGGSDKTQPSQSQAASEKTLPLPPAESAKHEPAPAKKAPVQPKAVASEHIDKQKTAQSQKPATESKAFYTVQVGVFKNKANASALVKKYKKLQYHAFTQKGRGKNKKAFYRVLVGRFGSEKEAAVVAKDIRSKENIQTLIFHKK